jgi:CBS domain-containing protein
MTSDPAYCVPEDNVVRAAMLMKQHNVGSIPVVSSRGDMKLEGIVTDRDLTLRVVAEQRDYYKTTISDVMTDDLVTCRQSDDYEAVVKAMAKQQIRRVPVVDSQERLVGIISQADVALAAGKSDVAHTVSAISEPASVHAASGGPGLGMASLMIAGGLGLGAGLLYILDAKSSNY